MREEMTNQEILKIAMAQSAIDLCAEPDDFEKSENVIVTSRENEGARRFYERNGFTLLQDMPTGAAYGMKF